LQWKNAAQWWANLVTWTLPAQTSSMDINGQVVGDKGQLTVDLPPGTGENAGNIQQAQAHIIAPDESQQTISLQQFAADRWQGSFPTPQVGAYLVQVTWRAAGKNGEESLTAQSGLVVPYSPEYRSQGTDTRFLTQLAQAARGSLLGPDDTAKVWDMSLVPVSQTVPLTFWLLALAALLLPLDIAARRLASIEFLTVAYKWVLARLSPAQAQLTSAANAIAETPAVSSLSNIRTRRAQLKSRATVPKPPPQHTTQPKATRETPSKPTAVNKQPEVSTTEALLAAKRKRAQVRERTKAD
jgi:hypothetical protein